MNKKLLENIIIKDSASILEAYWKYTHNKQKILLVVDDSDEFKGVITHKEINNFHTVPEGLVSSIVNQNCKRAQYDEDKEKMYDNLRNIFAISKNIQSVPVIKENKVVDLLKRSEVFMPVSENKNPKQSGYKGNYSPLVEGIINEYLGANYNLNMESLDEVVKKYLINQKKIFETQIDNIKFRFEDSIISNTVSSVTAEINTSFEYNFRDIDFKQGDVVIDIGGNIGMVSIYLAKLFPFLKIYAYEPIRQNYECFINNIKLNNIPEGTIIVENKAVTCDGREVCMSVNATFSGGSSVSEVISVGAITQEINSHVPSTTLADIFKKYNINDLKLLKIDCEGSEYEILNNADTQLLRSIKSMRGEFHENKNLTDKYDIDNLYKYVSQYIDDVVVFEGRNCFVM